MKYKIEPINPSAYEEVTEVWEASVRATHHFLKEEDIRYFKPLIRNEYLKLVELWCIRNEQDRIQGFLGVADDKLEMLFITPEARGKGIGKALLDFAINELRVTQVDVNEDNEQAVGFYIHSGFETYNRSELDATGKPYPILHMQLK
ncbi:GNAT family N-acetyltransferase [Zhouia amylolytica]|uniref:N-acetyltransferase GCN5 n=1 Tax=Zhouia amylolytica AD3 TaxID=1286632 RepID=W2UJY7_9FLAO|nr:GNAT family N-acetyltransferase [Zhouia amylolytica]ETN94284.1 N-acetyltransferase GCN5 [Zhouia amylolytica AD3]